MSRFDEPGCVSSKPHLTLRYSCLFMLVMLYIHYHDFASTYVPRAEPPERLSFKRSPAQMRTTNHVFGECLRHDIAQLIISSGIPTQSTLVVDLHYIEWDSCAKSPLPLHYIERDSYTKSPLPLLCEHRGGKRRASKTTVF